MKRVAVLSDTHLSSGDLPEWVADLMGSTDHAIHAGDIDTLAGLETCRSHCRNGLTAARGNWDPRIEELPTNAVVDVEGVRFVATHGTTGPKNDYGERVAAVARRYAEDPETTVAVCGHKHVVIDTHVAGIRVINPGSATGMHPARSPTMMVVEVAGSDYAVHHYRDGERVDEGLASTAW